MPTKYKADFPTSLVIIDGTELRTQSPCALALQSQLYSDYKSSLIIIIILNLFGANIYMNNQMRLTSYKPTQPNPGEDIHHTVISCVGN